MLELINGCTEEETLVTYSMFKDNPHVLYLNMMSDEETSEEMVTVGFMHYCEELLVTFVTGFDVGDILKSSDSLVDLGKHSHYGEITKEGLLNFLESMPHIKSVMMTRDSVVH